MASQSATINFWRLVGSHLKMCRLQNELNLKRRDDSSDSDSDDEPDEHEKALREKHRIGTVPI